jgi:DNA repair protein RadA/Sms
MKLNYSTTSLIPVSDVEIPDVFFRRMRTDVEVIDRLFGGEGILPGMAFTITAAPGVGKTTLMLQICECLTEQGYDAGYITGEETITMLAYTCRRLGLKKVQVCHETNIHQICKMMERLDFIIIDSFASLVGNNGEKLRDDEAINLIVASAKQYECAAGVILHHTKKGGYKGSTVIPHAVDCNISIEINEEADDHRDLSTSKNRYGSPYHGVVRMNSNGYDLTKVVDGSSFTTKNAKSKSVRKEDAILSMKEPPAITISRVVQELGVSEAYARQMLYKLARDGKLIKIGSGDNAIWKFPVQ